MGNFGWFRSETLVLLPMVLLLVLLSLVLLLFGTSGGGGGSDTGEFNLGMNVRSFSCNTLDAITGVHLETEGGSYSTAGTDTGYVLKGMCNFASSTGVADICLSKTSGYVYRGFDAITAYLDPAYEIGDLLLFE